MCKRTGGGGVVIKLTFIKITSQNETFGSDYFLYHFYNKGLKKGKKKVSNGRKNPCILKRTLGIHLLYLCY